MRSCEIYKQSLQRILVAKKLTKDPANWHRNLQCPDKVQTPTLRSRLLHQPILSCKNYSIKKERGIFTKSYPKNKTKIFGHTFVDKSSFNLLYRSQRVRTSCSTTDQYFRGNKIKNITT